MIELSTPFVFPGEGCIFGGVDGIEITPDTPIDPSQLEYIPGTPHYRKRLERARDSERADPSSDTP